MQNNHSPKELMLDRKLDMLLNRIIGENSELTQLPLTLLDKLIKDEEIQEMQDFANNVAISRLGFNDHGPVHMRTVCYTALKMMYILHTQGIQTNLEKEGPGCFEDSILAVMTASFLHDIGMTVSRQDHELYSGIIAFSVVDRILKELLPEHRDIRRRIIIRSMVLEGIIGHMGTHKVHSLEAGLILIADGCDMTKGRARIPMEINTRPMVGDIHKYSANAIDKVSITRGEERPVRIRVFMSSEVGFFQVEEVLLQKIMASPIRDLVELYAGVEGMDMKRYQ